MVGFSGTLGTGQEDDKREINGWKKTLSRFRGKLVKMIRVLIVNLMIIHFCLKFYRIGVMN